MMENGQERTTLFVEVVHQVITMNPLSIILLHRFLIKVT